MWRWSVFVQSPWLTTSLTVKHQLRRCQSWVDVSFSSSCVFVKHPFPKTIISDASPSNSKTRENITKTGSIWANVLNSTMAKISIVHRFLTEFYWYLKPHSLLRIFPVRFPDIVDFATWGLSPVRSEKTDTCLQYHGLDTHTQTSKRDDKKNNEYYVFSHVLVCLWTLHESNRCQWVHHPGDLILNSCLCVCKCSCV